MEPIVKRPVGRPRKTPAITVPAKPKGDGLRRAANRARAAATPAKSYDFPVKPPELMPGVVPAGVTAPVMAPTPTRTNSRRPHSPAAASLASRTCPNWQPAPNSGKWLPRWQRS